MFGMKSFVDLYGRDISLSRRRVIFFCEFFFQLCVCDLGEVFFFFIIGAV